MRTVDLGEQERRCEQLDGISQRGLRANVAEQHRGLLVNGDVLRLRPDPHNLRGVNNSAGSSTAARVSCPPARTG